MNIIKEFYEKGNENLNEDMRHRKKVKKNWFENLFIIRNFLNDELLMKG